MFTPKKAEREKTLTILERFAEKVKLQNPGTRGINLSVFPAPGAAEAYVIEFSKGRVARQVSVDEATLRRLRIRPVDPVLMRALRRALQVVVARARQRESLDRTGGQGGA